MLKRRRKSAILNLDVTVLEDDVIVIDGKGLFYFLSDPEKRFPVIMTFPEAEKRSDNELKEAER